MFHQSIRCEMDSKIGSHSFMFISLLGKRMSASSLRWDGLHVLEGEKRRAGQNRVGRICKNLLVCIEG